MKSFSSEALAALASGDNIVSGAVMMGHAPNILRLWGGYGVQVIDGQAFMGVGDRGLVSATASALGGAEAGATLRLSGLDPEAVGGIDLRLLRRAPVILWRLIFDGSGSRLLQASVFLRGSVDHAKHEAAPGGEAAIVINVEGPARGLGRRSERMRTDADQRLISAADGGLRRIAWAGEKSIYFGGQKPQRAGAAFGAGANYGGGSGGQANERNTQVM